MTSPAPSETQPEESLPEQQTISDNDEADVNDETQQEQESDLPESKPTKKRKEANGQPITREPGKSLLPFSRVQKILKADKELPIVAREATYLISLAAEEFIKQMAEEICISAQRGSRVTVQYRDVATVVRKADKFMFLDEIIPWHNPDAQAKRKPKALQEKDDKARPTTMLDTFVQKGAADVESGSQGHDEDIVMNEDGTMSVG
ncbi:unnamed protein product [Somion occarium]|uniref:Transcription factor CBF/NF-Y/archaeal histone domain-containing protein n=1 Tax=Somion occarium TaxID=3059160 RepID=A0ABP1CF10_9APHY